MELGLRGAVMHHRRGKRVDVKAAKANFRELGKRVVGLHPAGNGDRGRGQGKQIQVDIREKGR